jgi:hypothetical protein
VDGDCVFGKLSDFFFFFLLDVAGCHISFVVFSHKFCCEK